MLKGPTAPCRTTEAEPFDVDGTYLRLTGAFCNPKPIQRPHPRSWSGDARPQCSAWSPSTPTCGTSPAATSRDAIRRGALLDRYRPRSVATPVSVTRSIYLPVSSDQPSITQDAIGTALDAGFWHIVLGLPAPYLANIAQWATDEGRRLIPICRPARHSCSRLKCSRLKR